MNDDDDLICPRCKNPISVLPGETGEDVYFCYSCMREVEPIEEDEDKDPDWRPEFEVMPTDRREWAYLIAVALLIGLAVWIEVQK